jgi:hypothetical protein
VIIGFSSGKVPKGQEEEPMKDWKSLSHVKWECKYHIVIVLKYRHKTIYGKIRKKIAGIIRCKRKRQSRNPALKL